MTQDQKKADLGNYLVTKGIVMPNDIEAEIKRMAGLLAPAEAAEKGLQTDIDKAYAVMEYEKGNAASEPAPTQVAPTPTTPATPAPTVSAAEMLGIQKGLLKQKNDRKNVSANSLIEKYIFDRPAPSSYIPEGAKGTISKETWAKIEEKYAGKVLADDPAGENSIASTTNYNILKAAADAGTPVDVYVGNLNTKAIGYIANLGNSVGNAASSTPITREAMGDFLTMDAAGYILATATTPGVRLRYVEPKADKVKVGVMKPGKSVLVDANKKAAIEAGNYVVSREVDATAEVKEKLAKSALCFKVDTGKPKSNGKGNIIKTVRVSVKTPLPELVRKPEYAKLFPDKAGNSDLTQIPDETMINNITQAQQFALAELRQKLGDPNEYMKVAKFEAQLKAFDAAPAGATPDVAI